MKTLLVLSIALVCALAHRSIEDLADMNAGVSQTNNGKCICCPKIASTSVIQPITGYRGNAAIIADWGDCTPEDGPFEWLVDWGDGERSYGSHAHLNNFQVVHQYPKYRKQYRVLARYCKFPYPCPYAFRPCCDNFLRVINVSYNG